MISHSICLSLSDLFHSALTPSSECPFVEVDLCIPHGTLLLAECSTKFAIDWVIELCASLTWSHFNVLTVSCPFLFLLQTIRPKFSNFHNSYFSSNQGKVGNPTPGIQDCTQSDNSKCTFHSFPTITLTQLFCSHLLLHNTGASSALPRHPLTSFSGCA